MFSSRERHQSMAPESLYIEARLIYRLSDDR
jgi:hypothetical protein